ncbi:hypothetical protein ACFQL1_15830 [Halomicroarcula sp. GCM10025709]|nr:hypothetical protein [Halomicroarcula sp. YJ-61-S]
MASDGPLPDGAVGEFASTFKEWHYLIGGFCVGVLVGIEYGRRISQD